MKKIFKFFVPVMALAVISCGDDEIKRTESPAFNPDAEQVFFYNDVVNPSSIELLPTDSLFEIVIGREVYEYAKDVKLKLVDNSGAFSIPSSVSFAAGDSIDTIQVWVDTEKLEFFKDYSIELSIDDSKSVNPYVAAENGAPVWSINVIVSDYKKFDDGIFSSEFFEQAWPQEILYSEIKNAFKFVDPYAVGYSMEFTVDSLGAIDGYKKDKDGRYVFDAYNHSTYGIVTMHVWAGQKWMKYSNYDPATKTLIFDSEWTVSAGSFGEYYESFTFSGDGIPWVKLPEPGDEGGEVGDGE